MSTVYSGTKQPLNFWQIWNMCFGFFGIQFGWSLQMGNMSAIYEFLGAKPEEIPGLWLAAPMTGLLVQLSIQVPGMVSPVPVRAWLILIE